MTLVLNQSIGPVLQNLILTVPLPAVDRGGGAVSVGRKFPASGRISDSSARFGGLQTHACACKMHSSPSVAGCMQYRGCASHACFPSVQPWSWRDTYMHPQNLINQLKRLITRLVFLLLSLNWLLIIRWKQTLRPSRTKVVDPCIGEANLPCSINSFVRERWFHLISVSPTSCIWGWFELIIGTWE